MLGIKPDSCPLVNLAANMIAKMVPSPARVWLHDQLINC